MRSEQYTPVGVQRCTVVRGTGIWMGAKSLGGRNPLGRSFSATRQPASQPTPTPQPTYTLSGISNAQRYGWRVRGNKAWGPCRPCPDDSLAGIPARILRLCQPCSADDRAWVLGDVDTNVMNTQSVQPQSARTSGLRLMELKKLLASGG